MALDKKWAKNVEQILSDLQDGLYAMPTGPGMVRGKQIAPHSITSTLIDVDELAAVSASTGNLNVTGTITVAASFPASGPRITLDSTALDFYRDATHLTSQFAVDGSGFVGSTGGTSATAAMSWTTTGVATINADKIITGTLAFGSAGTVNTTGSVSGTIGNSGGTLNLGALTVAGTITIGSGGKIIDADGSFWDQTGLTLIGGSSGATGDSIIFENGLYANPQSKVYSGFNTSLAFLGLLSKAASGNRSALVDTTATTSNSTTNATLQANSSTAGENTDVQVVADGNIVFTSKGNEVAEFDNDANRSLLMFGRLYPGTGSAFQNSTYLDYNSTFSAIRVAGVGHLEMTSLLYYTVNTGAGSGALPNPTTVIAIADRSTGTVYYIPAFSNFSAWAA